MTTGGRDVLEGTITSVGDAKEVSTQYGTSDLAEVTVATETGEERVTCWGKWTETTAVAEPGMRLRVTNPEEREYRGETQYATTGDSYVVLEPQFLVDVTDVREYVQCPRMYYLNKLSSAPLKYPVIKGTIVHEVFGDLLRGVAFDEAVDDRVDEAGLDLGLLGMDREEVREEVAENARAIDAWLSQGKLSGDDEWRSEMTLISETYGIKGRVDAVRNGMPVELKTGKRLQSDPRFEDKIQATSYALLLQERGVDVDTATLLYTKNAALDRSEFSGDFSPAKEFSVGDGLMKYVVRSRNAIAAFEYDFSVPTGYEADAVCEYCFEQDTCRVVAGRLQQESKAGQIGRALPDEELEYYESTYRAIEEERRETHREYAKLWEQTPAERADDDRALVDLEFESKRERADGRWELRARRTSGALVRQGRRSLHQPLHPLRVRHVGQQELPRRPEVALCQVILRVPAVGIIEAVGSVVDAVGLDPVAALVEHDVLGVRRFEDVIREVVARLRAVAGRLELLDGGERQPHRGVRAQEHRRLRLVFRDFRALVRRAVGEVEVLAPELCTRRRHLLELGDDVLSGHDHPSNGCSVTPWRAT